MERTDEVALLVYNLQGRQVALLHQGLLSRGEHSFRFEADGLASGVYLVSLESGSQRITRKALLVK